jgi:hypothetical protein
MKTMIMLCGIFLLILILVGADFRKETPQTPIPAPKKKCIGYTIIEFGKGIDCNGDTVVLQKVQGGQVLARKLQQEALQAAN